MKLADVNTRYRQGRDGAADSYRQARWHLRCAREYAAALHWCGGYQRGSKRRCTIIVNALLWHLQAAEKDREMARWFRRMRALGCAC